MGDSLSEGVGDPLAGWSGQLRGWVRHLGSAERRLHLVGNLARSGATVALLRRTQLPRVAELRPDLVTCVIGVNDVLRPRFDPEGFERDYEHVIGQLRACASRGVVTMNLHDVAEALPLPARWREALEANIQAANAVIERVSARHAAALLDTRDQPSLVRAGMLCLDRLHPNERGHRHVAAAVLRLLRSRELLPPGPEPPVPVVPIHHRMRSEAHHLAWLVRRELLPRLRRTSTD